MSNYLERASMNWSSNSIRLIETAGSHAKNNYLYIQEAGYFETFYPYFTERKNLSSYLIVYTISGKGRLRYKENEYILTKGMIFLIDCIEYHYYETFKTEPWEILWIHFYGINASGYYEDFTRSGFKILEPKDSFIFESSLRRIVSINIKRDRHRELISSGLITSILVELILLTSPEEYFDNFMPTYIKTVRTFIEANYRQPISLSTLAYDINMSKFYLAKEFKRYMGVSIHESIIQHRITYAKDHLKYSELSVSEIAENCGIPNVSHFINLFKTREGITPLRFRKEWRI